jgi:hypothetical protein
VYVGESPGYVITLWIPPFVSWIKVGIQFSLTDLAVKPARVIPAENGCYSRLVRTLRVKLCAVATYPRCANRVLVPDMDVFNGYLDIVHNACRHALNQTLLLLRTALNAASIL